MFTFNQLKKNLRKDTGDLKPVKMAVLADAATQLLTQAIRGYGVETGLYFDVYEADYNQVNSEVFNPSSALHAFNASFVLVNLSTEHLLKEFYHTDRGKRL